MPSVVRTRACCGVGVGDMLSRRSSSARMRVRHSSARPSIQRVSALFWIQLVATSWIQKRAETLWMLGRADECRTLMRAELERLESMSPTPTPQHARVLTTLGIGEGLSGNLKDSIRHFRGSAESSP